MVSKNNFKNKMEQTAARTPHYGIRKLSVGVASVLISTTLYMGATTAKADTLPSTATDAATINPETASSSSSTRTNTTADNTAKATVPTTASSTDTSVSTTPNAQASTTNTTAGATSSDKSSANNNTLVTNNVEPTVNTTAQAQPKPNVVTSDKANVDNQVGSNVENKATTTTDTISAPTTPKRVVRSLAAAPTTNSKELVENQDYTVSNVSLEDHKKQDNFDEDATFLHADIKAKNGDVIANTQNQTVDITYAATRQVVNGSWTLKYVDKNNHDKEILPSTNIKLQFARNLNADQKTYGDWYIVDNSLSQTGTNLKVLSLEKTANDTTEDGFNRDNFSIKVQLPNSPSENYRKEYGTFTFTWGILNDRDQDSTMENTSFVDYPEQKKITITYVDDDGDGEVISKESLTGDIGTEVKTFIRDYSGYALNGDYPQTITMTNDTKDIIVHMKHKTETRKVILDLQLFLKRILLLDNDKSNIEITAYDEQGKNSSFSDFSYGKIPFNITIDLSNSLVANVSPADGFDISQLSKPFTLTQGSTGDFYYSGKTLSQVLADYVKEGKLDKSYLDNPIKAYASYKGTISNANISNHNTFKKYNNIFYNADGSLKDNYLSIISTNGEKLGDKVIDKITIPNSFFTPENIKDLLNNYHYNLPIFGFDDEAPLDIPFEVDYVPYAEKQVTRTINIKNPDGTTKKIVQTATIDRKVIFNGEGNADWSTGSFDSYDVPVIEGYTASQSKVDTATVTSDTQNSEVNITYTANDQAIKINYVDSDNNGSVVKSDTLSGKTDQTVKTGITIPDGYVIEGNVPTDYTFKASGNTDITVKLKHGTTTVTPDKPKTTGDKLPDNPSKNYPSGVAESDLNKTVTRTIKVTDPQGKVTTTTQTVHLTRTATVDEVTGDVTYSDWSTGSFDSYDVPVIEGYTATQSKVDTATVTSDTQNSEVNVTYTANPQSIKINYVDDDKGGATVKSDALNGKTDETVKTGITIPENYTVVGTAPSDYTFKAKDNADITVHLKHVIDTTSEEKTITRTIKVTNPNGGVMTIPQSAKSTRTVSTDKVTGEVTYGDWSKADLDGYDVPLIEGYTASQSSVAKTTVDGSNEDNVVEINYTPNKQVISIDYVDNGKVIATQVLTGKTDQTVKTNIQSPDKDKYVLVGNNPESYTFKAKDNADIRVEVKHVINDSTESKDVTRTIIVTRPDGKETTEVQKATVSRTVHTDAVTGAKTYDEWSKATLDKYDVPVVNGYTPSLNVVERLEVDGDSKDSVVKVGYTANEQTAKIVYVDGDNGNSIVKSDTLTGKTDETVKTGVKVPDGYVIDGNVPTDYTFKVSGNPDITVKLKHGITTVTPDKPKTTNDKLPDNPSKSYPEGVSENDLNKTVTRTIKVTDPKGKVTTTTQTVHLTRTATVDEVTGEVTYSDWSTGKWDNYKIPAIEGYDSNVDQVDGQEVTFDTKNQTVEVSYTKLVDPDRSTTPVKEENNTETPKQSQDKVQSKFVDTGLPQTGEKDNEKVSVLGAVIASLAAGLGLAGIRRKKDKN